MLKAALVLDNCKIAYWQKKALEFAIQDIDLRLILSCENTVAKKTFRNGLYYLLNIVSIKSFLTKRNRLTNPNLEVLNFKANTRKNWQILPEHIKDKLRKKDVDIIIKFGMSLLYVDEDLKDYKILSFHHGDPSLYRGRPAGFYEVLFDAQSVGTIVQSISNKIDGGTVWAIGYSKIFPYSYRKTSISFYQNSIFLLKKAIKNIENAKPVRIDSSGKLYRLPDNKLVMKFSLIVLKRKLKRLLYGIFYEKQWNIIKFPSFDFLKENLLNIKNGRFENPENNYSFYADPFFSNNGEELRVEAMCKKTGIGKIVSLSVDSLKFKKVLLDGPHFSYPFSFLENGKEFLLPEVASHAAPYMLSESYGSLNKIKIRGLEKYRLVDSTYFRHKGVSYIFCSMSDSSLDKLYLFFANSLRDEFISHPLNPIVINPSSARMGGRIFKRNRKIYRLGQVNRGDYGNGLSIQEITKISSTDYEENFINELRFANALGPHTLDSLEDLAVMDFYENKFSIFAWYRRLLPLLLRIITRV